MKHKLLIIQTLMLISLTTIAQNSGLLVEEIHQNSILFSWKEMEEHEVILEYGFTNDLELGKINGLLLTNLSAASFYYVKARSLKNPYQETSIKLFSTASTSSGDITVYFNQWVNNSASLLADAIHVPAFEDTIIAYINRAQNTIDICNYNTGSIAIVTAVNNAEASGVTVRYIAADNTGTNNNELSNLSPTIPIIQRPSDGNVMHNKFLIIDVADSSLSKVVTGSANHTNTSLHLDYNNLVIIEDQSLALAYKTEFEEMWGSTSNIPNITNAKFGNSKTDNTPHSFNLGGTLVELYFSPSDATTSYIESAILSANTDMQFAMLTFTRNNLGDAVLTVHAAGVNTKGIIENSPFIGSEYNSLLSAGVDVYSHFSEPYFLHHKYCIVDANDTLSNPLVITGSHNWTNSAENDNDENTLVIHDAEIANMYYEEFMARYAEITGTISVTELSNSSVNFYPNPVSDILNIQSDNKIKSVKIISIVGRTLINLQNLYYKYQTVDMSSVPNGVYLVSIKTDTENIVLKVIKNK